MSVSLFKGASVLITGGTGSFGKAFTQAVLAHADPRRLIIFSRDEYKQYLFKEAFKNHPKAECLRFFIGDVRDADRLSYAFKDVEYVVHAAALKQVDTAEYNPFECIKTNVVGAENVVAAAIAAKVRRVIALSTDKACAPINIYGASKLASDKIFVAARNLVGFQDTRFSVVRYGNVMASRGSVIELFQRLVAQGATSLPITDPRMTRFWITLGQGVQFVLSCFSMMRGGELFVPKIPSMRVLDIASAIGPECDTHVVGIRPGEKLHEMMITQDDARSTWSLPDRYVIDVPEVFQQDRYYPQLGAGTMPDGFEYMSNNNDDWLDADRLVQMLDRLRVQEASVID